jgi:hypothetical protein
MTIITHPTTPSEVLVWDCATTSQYKNALLEPKSGEQQHKAYSCIRYPHKEGSARLCKAASPPQLHPHKTAEQSDQCMPRTNETTFYVPTPANNNKVLRISRINKPGHNIVESDRKKCRLMCTHSRYTNKSIIFAPKFNKVSNHERTHNPCMSHWYRCFHAYSLLDETNFCIDDTPYLSIRPHPGLTRKKEPHNGQTHTEQER